MRFVLVFCAFCFALLPRPGGAQESVEFLEYFPSGSSICGVQFYFTSSYFDSVQAGGTSVAHEIGHHADAVIIGRRQRDAVTANAWMVLAHVRSVFHEDEAAHTAALQTLRIEESLAAGGAKSAERAFRRGAALDFLDRDDEAIVAYEQAMRLDPDYYPALFARIDHLDAFNGNWHNVEKQRERYLERVERLHRSSLPDSMAADVAYRLFWARCESKMDATMREYFGEIGDAVRDNVDSMRIERVARGLLGGLTGSLSDAEGMTLLQEAMTKAPSHREYEATYAAVVIGNAFLGIASDAFANKSKDSNGDGEMSAQDFAFLLHEQPARLRAVQDARNRLDRLCRSDGHRLPIVHYYRAIADVLLGDCASGSSAMQEAIRRRPDLPELYGMLCGSYLLCMGDDSPYRGDGDALLATVEAACLKRQYGEPCLLCGYIALARGETAKSIESFQRAMFYLDDATYARFGIAAALIEERRFVEARTWLDVIERSDETKLASKHTKELLQARAVLAVAQGNRAAAHWYVDRALLEDDEYEEALRLREYLNQ